jgi:hypothetical protein
LFLDTRTDVTAIDTILRDSAVLVSFALQAGIEQPPSARPWHLTDPSQQRSTRSKGSVITLFRVSGIPPE